MAVKPTEDTRWATLGAGGGGASSAIRTATDATRWDFGWKSTPGNLPGEEGERPNLNEQNYWQYAVHKWVEYFEEITDITQNAIVPLGGIVGVSSDLTGAFDSASGVVTNGYILCDGTAIPGGNTVSGTTPNLTDSRFLMGSSTAGTTGGNASNQINIQHRHNISHTHQWGLWNRFSTIRSGLYAVSFSESASTPKLTAINSSLQYGVQEASSGGTGSGLGGNSALSDGLRLMYTSGALVPPNGTLGTAESSDQLSATQSILPQYYTVKYFMRVN